MTRAGTVLDLVAVGCLTGMFVVGWLSFMAFQTLEQTPRVLLFGGGILVYGWALQRLTAVTLWTRTDGGKA